MIEIPANIEETQKDITMEAGEYYGGNYEELQNLPTFNGETLKGSVNERDPTVPAWAKSDTKPAYTPGEIGAVDESQVMTLEEIDNIFQNL
jgi:hypothetical protein